MSMISSDWYEILKPEIVKSNFKKFWSEIEKDYSSITVYPPKSLIFNALNLTPFSDVKVVIIGQDPYHNVNQAHGLCFSVQRDVKLPPSLMNIFKEIKNDYPSASFSHGNLTAWAHQGVLLLNAVLTVKEGQPNSYAGRGWEQITSFIIKYINDNKTDIVFLLWGAYAQKFGSLINTKKHHVLKAVHPSPLSANRGGWFGNGCFKKCNDILYSLNKSQIDWNIK